MTTTRHRRRAFTLMELLVVAGVIALLVGVLLPVLGRARVAGRSAACLSNQRELLAVGLTRASGNGGYLPLAGQIMVPSGTSGYDSLPRALFDPGRTRYVYVPEFVSPTPMLERPAEPLQALAEYAGVPTGLRCPERATEPWDYPAVNVGTPETLYYFNPSAWPRGYAMNGAFSGFRFDDPTSRHRLRGRLVAVKGAADVMWTADSDGATYWAHNVFEPNFSARVEPAMTLADFLMDDETPRDLDDLPWVENARIAMLRHGGRVNVAYLDGSVRATPVTASALSRVRLAAASP